MKVGADVLRGGNGLFALVAYGVSGIGGGFDVQPGHADDKAAVLEGDGNRAVQVFVGDMAVNTGISLEC